VTDSRRRRGRDTERALAAWLNAHGFPDARAVEAFKAGPDILGIPGWAIEVKAAGDIRVPPAYLRQAARQTPPGDRHLLVARVNGQGTTDPGQWAAIQTLNQWRQP